MQQKIIFTGAMNSDTANELLPPNESRFRINVRVLSSDTNNIGAAETVNGNVLVAYTLPAGNNTVIGATEYQLDKKNYYFVYNSLGNHSILEYDQVLNIVNVVFRSPILNFKITNLITGINVIRIDVGKTLLYWTDGWINPLNPNDFNEPKKINIEKGKAFMAGLPGGYKAPFDSDILYRIKKPPLQAPNYVWSGLPPAEFKASNRFTHFTLRAGDPAVTTIFDNDYFNPAHQYNPANGIWTVGTTRSYNVNAQVRAGFNVTGGQYGIFHVQILVNNVQVYTIASGQLHDGDNVSLIAAKELALTAGDQVKITSSLTNFGNATVYAVDFSAYAAQTSSLDINHLFKKLFQFKVQFKYDDYEISAWSPISNYEFPVTIAGSTGEDIILQDNKIELTVPTGSQIVTAIRIAAKEISSTDFTLVAELNKTQLGILDNSFYTYEFTNEINGVPLEANESIKLFDNVPLTSQTHDLIKGIRLVDGNITENFDPVPVDMRLGVIYAPVDLGASSNGYFPALSYLKDGGLYDLGIVYYDHANRSGLTNLVRGKSSVILPNGTYGTQLYIPFLTESDYNPANPNGDMSVVPLVNADIYNRPPEWATHYQIVRSKNLIMGRYIQFVAQDVSYVDVDGNVALPSVATKVIVNLSNITGEYLKENPNSKLVYDFVAGDRIRFIANPTGTGNTFTALHPFLDFNDTEITAWDAATGNISFLINGNNVLRDLGRGVLFEIYNALPQVIADGELTYEIDECYDILTLPNGDRVHQGKDSNQAYVQFSNDIFQAGFVGFITVGLSGFSIGDKVKAVSPVPNTNNTYGTITNIIPSGGNQIIVTDILFTASSAVNAGTLIKPAQTTLRGGDNFRRFCNMPWVFSAQVYRLYSYIDNMNASNFFTSNAYNTGRPNSIDPNIIRVTRPSTITYSNKLIPETFINGLSSTSDNNFETYELPYGGIYNLDAADQRLIMYQELKIASIPVEQSIVNTTQGETVVGQSIDVLSPTAEYLTKDLGIGRHPESFARREQATYGIDVKRGVVWRLSTDGLTPISEYFQHNFFTDLCKKILLSPDKVNIYGVFDIRFNEYIIAVSQFTYNGITVPAQTLAFNEKYNAWSAHYSFVPENMVGNGVNIISFKNGQLWKHNENAVQGSFYGIQFKAEIWVVCNQMPSEVKVLTAISEETNDAWECYEISTVNGQLSNLIESDFQEIENLQYAAVLFDANTPNVVNSLIEGDTMRDTTFLLKFRYNPTTHNKLFALNCEYIISNRHNR